MKTKSILTASLLTTSFAQGGLTLAYQFNGTGNWSLDGVGSNSTPVGSVQAVVPVGSTVERAFLYSSAIVGGSLTSVNFDGTLLGAGDFTSLGVTSGLQAYRADVTSQVAASIGGGSGTPFEFMINSESPNSSIDGEVLAGMYSNPAESVRTIAFLDGASATTGDSFSFNTASLPDPAAAGFEALLSVGVGYSFQEGGVQQASEIDVNGRRLTSSAGGSDDGFAGNGGLITVGGLGDDPANPSDPFIGPADRDTDDELYNLALGNGVDANPFISEGDTGIFIETLNPSSDDNIFFAGLNITAEGSVIIGPPVDTALPEPSSAITLAALLGLGLTTRRRQR